MTHTSAPEATVIATKGRTVTILCPYCDRQHSHTLAHDAQHGDWHRFAPACGFERTPDQRATGYRFRITTTKHDEPERN